MIVKGSFIIEDIIILVLLLVYLYRKFVCQKKGRCYNVCDIIIKICLVEKMEVLLFVILYQVVCQKIREVFVILFVYISMFVSKKGGVIVYDIIILVRFLEKGRCYCFRYYYISLFVRKGEVLLFVILFCQFVVEKGR